MLKNFDSKRFANVLGYHAHYFKALAYWHLGSSQYQKADDEGKGMNKAVTYLQVCTALFAEARGYAQACGGAYLANFEAKSAAAQQLLTKAVNDNKQIYREPRIEAADLPTVDAQNFVKLEPMTETL